jgi:hypothetical protein
MTGTDVGLISKKLLVGIFIYLVPLVILAGGLFIISALLR